MTQTAPPNSRQYLTEGSCERKFEEISSLKKFKYIKSVKIYVSISWPIIISAVFQISMKCANISLIFNRLENARRILRKKFENEKRS